MSYSGSPGDSDVDAVRHYIGDTDEEHEFLSNEEIEYELAQVNDDVTAASANCAERIAARLFPRVDYRVHGVWINGSELAKNLRQIATQLQQSDRLAGAGPYVGGISKAEKTAEESVSDLRDKAFEVGMHDHP